MIKILALREFYSEKQKRVIKAEVWNEHGYRAPNVEHVFLNPDELLESINVSERKNVYYTVAECAEGEGRKLLIQHHIPFDVDGIDVPEVDTDAHLTTLAEIVCQAIGVPSRQVGILFSGNGLQFLVGSLSPIEDEGYFERNREHYGAICDRIDLALGKAGLEGKADRSVWSAARLMRMPKTWNEKPGKPRRMSRILNANIERIEFDVTKASGLPELGAGDIISESVVRAFPTPDTKTILEECKFLSWCQTSPEKVSEPEWYAMLSITSRMPEGRKISHRLSEGHPKYTFEETEQKIDQSMSGSSGPRTCRNINAISGGRCAGCKHNGTTLSSPILIKGPDHISTELTGFRFPGFDKDGKPKLGKPDIEGLRKFLIREKKAIVLRETGTIWTFNGKYFENLPRMEVMRFCQKHIQPEPSIGVKNEFFDSVQKVDEARAPDFFEASTRGRVNFQNGVLDVRTGHFHDHGLEFGFRSVLSCEYSKDATAPRFLKFMDDVMLGRQDLIAVIQEFMGYIFANEDCRYEKALMLVGDGANGKSTLVGVIRKLAGKHGSSNLPVSDLQNEQAVKLVEGKMVNLAEENSDNAFANEGSVKNFISGGELRIKVPYEATYEIKNNAKLVMLCNRLPKVRDHSHGFWRRFLMIPFDATFTEETKDVGLADALEKELPGIMNWAMEGYQRLSTNKKFTFAKDSEKALSEYRKEVNPVELFLEEMCALDPEPEIRSPATEVFDAFMQWADMGGYRNHGITRVAFTRLLIKMIERQKAVRVKDIRMDDQQGRKVRAIPHLRLLSAGGGRI